MKNKNPLYISILSLSLFISCGDTETTQSEEQELNQLIEQEAFLCSCLTEAANSEFMKENKDACRDVISKEIGVENWEKINMRDNPEISDRFDELAARCTGTGSEGGNVTADESMETEEGNTEAGTETEKAPSSSTDLMDKITSDAGFVWETVNNDADIYTVLTFNGNEFRNVAYNMNGSTNPKDFTRVVALSGTWQAKGDKKAIGSFTETDTKVEWTFNDDYTMLINGKGVQYRKVSMN